MFQTNQTELRTLEQIQERIKTSNDFFGFEDEVLLPYLPLDLLSQIEGVKVKDEATYKPQPLDKDAVIAEMASYMEFAWGKVEDHRGLSAGRSVSKMRVWLWLLRDDELYEFADDSDNYSQYGAPILAKICEKYGFPVPSEPGIQRMISGMPCTVNCSEGCGM